MLLTQIVQLVAQKQEQASDFAQAEQQKRDELEPRIREREEEIAKLKEELKEDELKIRKAQEENERAETELTELKGREEEYEAQIRLKEEDKIKEQQEPIRITKHNESTSQGVDKLEEELKKQSDIKKKHEFDKKNLDKKIKDVATKESDQWEELRVAKEEDKNNQKNISQTADAIKRIDKENKEQQNAIATI